MFKHFDMKDYALKSILMKKKICLDIKITDKLLCKTDKEHYQLYLSLETRSDILFAVVILS